MPPSRVSGAVARCSIRLEMSDSFCQKDLQIPRTGRRGPVLQAVRQVAKVVQMYTSSRPAAGSRGTRPASSRSVGSVITINRHAAFNAILLAAHGGCWTESRIGLFPSIPRRMTGIPLQGAGRNCGRPVSRLIRLSTIYCGITQPTSTSHVILDRSALADCSLSRSVLGWVALRQSVAAQRTLFSRPVLVARSVALASNPPMKFPLTFPGQNSDNFLLSRASIFRPRGQSKIVHFCPRSALCPLPLPHPQPPSPLSFPLSLPYPAPDRDSESGLPCPSSIPHSQLALAC